MEVLPSFTQLSSRVVRVLGLNPGKFTLQGTNTYLIGTGQQRILVDTGEGKSDYIPLLVNSLKTLGEHVFISDILISHWHYDHVGGVDSILQYAKENNWPAPCVHKMLNLKQDKLHIFRPIEDNQIFKTEGATLCAIFTPGHCEDHFAFYMEEENALFTADSVLGHGTTVFADLEQYLTSLQRMKQLNPGRLYPGHGPVIEDGVAKLDQYIDHRIKRENQILEVLKVAGSPVALRQIIEVIYDEVPKIFWPAAEHNITLHLTKLEKEKKVYKLSTGNDIGKWVLFTYHFRVNL